MNRLENFIRQYTWLSDDCFNFLVKYGRITTYTKDSLFVDQDETKYYWCLLLNGMIGYRSQDHKGDYKLEKIIMPYHYFVGTKHIYSQNSGHLSILFLQNSELYTIHNMDLQHGIKTYPEINLLYHILKQRNLDATNHFIHINRIDRVQRLYYFYTHFPYAEGKLTIRELCSLLAYSDTRQYYRALSYYYSHR